MSAKHDSNSAKEPDQDFAQSAQEAPEGLLREFLGFLSHSKKWWLIPLLVVLLLVGVLVILGSTALGPLLYPLF
jgi:hypothetical protein